jgi:hypothetical protein
VVLTETFIFTLTLGLSPAHQGSALLGASLPPVTRPVASICPSHPAIKREAHTSKSKRLMHLA